MHHEIFFQRVNEERKKTFHKNSTNVSLFFSAFKSVILKRERMSKKLSIEMEIWFMYQKR